MYICIVTIKQNNMATAQEIMKGRKKEELAQEIVHLLEVIEQSNKDTHNMMLAKDKEIAELQARIKNRSDEYERWKEFNGEFVERAITEYMLTYMLDVKDDIANEVGEKIAHKFSIETRSTGDYYSRGTDVRLVYDNEVISSDYISQ